MDLEALTVDRNIVRSLKQRRSDRSQDAFTFYQIKHGETRLDLLEFLCRRLDEVKRLLFKECRCDKPVNGVSVTMAIWRLFP